MLAWQRAHRAPPRARRAPRRAAVPHDPVHAARAPTSASACDATHRWLTGAEESVDGVPHLVNVPTEEVFTTPDRRLTEGTVRSTFPLALGGTIVRGLELRFEAGKIVEVRADSGVDAAREEMATDDGASYLGEVALVDGDSRVRQTGVVFLDTLFDENAASSHRLGPGHPDRPRGRREPDERRARGARLQRLDRPHRLHGRRPRGRRSSASRRAAPRCRSSTDDAWVLR